MRVVAENFEEQLVWLALVGTWGFYLLGALYLVAPVLGWLLGFRLLWRWCNPALHPGQRIHLPVTAWLWIACMGAMLLVLLNGHSDFSLSFGKTVKSSIGWAKGWALMALFVAAGSLPIRSLLLTRAVSLLCVQTLLLLPLFILAWAIGLPADLYVSPLQVIGGPGPEFFTVTLYGINPDTGMPRWRLFTPWGPALGFVANVCFFIALNEPQRRLRLAALAGAVVMVLVSGSRLGLVSLPLVAAAGFALSRLGRPWLHYIGAMASLLLGLFASHVLTILEDARMTFHAARPESSRVRAALGRIALDRWTNEAPWFGHGIVERGPHLVEYMPIGSHHTWFGLLFVKGLFGLLALAVPLVWTAAVLLKMAQREATARTALCVLLVLVFYSFGENLEVLAYLIWPGLLAIGIALRPVQISEPSSTPSASQSGVPLCVSA